MTINEIRRIRSCSRAFFQRHFERPLRPVVITDLYARSAISKITRREDVTRLIGNETVPIGANYYDGYRGLLNGRTREYLCTVADYFRWIDHEPRLDLLCRETRLPPALSNELEIPDIVPRRERSRSISFMFLANRGTAAPLHFDLDQRNVLFTQVLGTKRVILVRPEFSRRLYPVGNLSGIAVHSMPESERADFLRYVNAYTTVLRPGETIFIPKLWWHSLENLTTTFAFNVRYDRRPLGAKVGMLPGSYQVQNICSAIYRGGVSRRRQHEALEKIFSTYLRPYKTRIQRLRATAHTLNEVYESICVDSVPGVHVAEQFDKGFVDESQAIKKWPRYYKPARFRNGEFTKNGRLADAERRELETRMTSVFDSSAARAKFLSAFGIGEISKRTTKIEGLILLDGLERGTG